MMAEQAVAEHPGVVRIAGIPRDEIFHHVDVAHDATHQQRHFADPVNVPQGDDVFEMAQFAQRNQQHQHHAEAAKDRAGHEVERENGLVPAGELRRGEVHADDGTHGEHQQRRQAGQNEIGLFIIVPVPRRAGPTQREQAVKEFPHARLRPVAQQGQVGNQSHVPEQGGDDQVGVDGEHVPHQRRTELRPHAVREWNREQQPGKPDAPDVDGRIKSRHHDRENRHRLRRAPDGRAPMLPRQKQHRRNQRAGVRDADPPDEIDDVPAPRHRQVVAPDADAGGNLVSQHGRQHHRRAERRRQEQDPPPQRRLPFRQGREMVRQPAEAALIGRLRSAPQFRRRDERFQLDRGFSH